MQRQQQQFTGFSLVELSIVLVILGLLTGGILAGQSLIRAAELRKTMGLFTETQTAWNSFKDKYFELPGDMTNATNFWGRSTAGDWHSYGTCPAQPGAASATGTCNGDGNGWLTYSGGVAEHAAVWEHMNKAGLTNTAPNYGAPLMPNFPGGTYMSIMSNNSSTYALQWADIYYSNAPPNGLGTTRKGIALRIARRGDPFSSLVGMAAKPEDSWQIDTKVDDGKPLTGRFLATNGTTDLTGTAWAPCLATSGATYDYNLAYTTTACQLFYLLEQR